MSDEEKTARQVRLEDQAEIMGWTVEEVIAHEEKIAERAKEPRARKPFGPSVKIAPPPATPSEPGRDPSAAAGAEQILPRSRRRGAHGSPRGLSYRAQVKRRYLHQRFLPASRWHSKNGAHPRDCWTWLERGHCSPSRLERELVGALRREYLAPSGAIDEDAYRALYPVAALAYALYYAAEATHRRGYSAHVVGVPRGELARRMGHFHGGRPVLADTVSRYLGRLREIVGERGMLQWHQPSPAEAARWDLPRSTHYMDDGRQLEQPVNVYWFVSEEWFAKNAAPHLRGAPTIRDDRSAGYGQPQEIARDVTGSPSGGKESTALRAPPTEDPAARGAASRRSAPPQSGDRGRATR